MPQFIIYLHVCVAIIEVSMGTVPEWHSAINVNNYALRLPFSQVSNQKTSHPILSK